MLRSSHGRHYLAALVLGAACTPAQRGGDVQYSGSPAKASPLVTWPTARGDQAVERTLKVTGSLDGGMTRFHGAGALATAGQEESQDPLFELADGAVLSNVILGHPAADGVHCKGSCTLNNVWWEDVGEDAATFLGQAPSDSMLIDGGGASDAVDKVFQDNGFGTLHIRNFYVESFGKLFRSCGNCSRQMDRHVVVEDVTAVTGEHTVSLLGLNSNYGDSAEFRGSNVIYDRRGGVPICLMFEANDTGAEPRQLGPAADGNSCKNLVSNVVVHRSLN